MTSHPPRQPDGPPLMARQQEALLALLRSLKANGYEFVTPAPATHARVIARRDQAKDIKDVLGWSLPFSWDLLDPAIRDLLVAGGALQPVGALYRSNVRVSSLKGHLFLHSAYPTVEETAVFFGPDSYRFADLIERELASHRGRGGMRICDMGTGSGVGAIIAGALSPGDARIMASDINPRAIGFARINAAAAGMAVDLRLGADMAGIEDACDLILMNPPYIIDPDGRLYRDGGTNAGAGVTLAMAGAAIDRLAPDGRLIVYSGSAIIAGADHLFQALARLCEASGCTLHYRELDPDVFGEELTTPHYAKVERIAVVAARITRR